MSLAELIERAKRLSQHHPLRQALLLDLLVLSQSADYAESTPGVPGCISAMIGLSINHLHARLLTCEERDREHGAYSPIVFGSPGSGKSIAAADLVAPP